MLPTLNGDREIVWVDNHYHGGRNIRTGDVVNLWDPVRNGQLLSKRVMGLEGNEYIKRTPLPGVERMKVRKHPFRYLKFAAEADTYPSRCRKDNVMLWETTNQNLATRESSVRFPWLISRGK